MKKKELKKYTYTYILKVYYEQNSLKKNVALIFFIHDDY